MERIEPAMSAPTIAPVLLTPAEAARVLGTSERHLRRLRMDHGLVAVHLGGKVRYRLNDLLAFIDLSSAAEPRASDSG